MALSQVCTSVNMTGGTKCSTHVLGRTTQVNGTFITNNKVSQLSRTGLQRSLG